MEHSVYSSKTNCLYFAGDDQNDFTDIEPIGCLDFDKELIKVDKSELTLWFEEKEVTTQLSAEQIYSDDTKMTELMNLDSSMKNEDLNLKDEEFNNLLNALGDIIDGSDYSEQASNESQLDDDSLLGELLDEVIKHKPIVANAGNDMTYHSGDDDFAVIILDGTATMNQQGKIIKWSWTDDTGKEISTLTKFRAKLSVGMYRFELRVSDLEGNSTADSVQVEVV